MKKLLSLGIIFLLLASTFSTFAFQIAQGSSAEKTRDKIVSLPALAIHGGEDTWLLEVDKQVVEVNPGETFTIKVKYQIWSTPGIIRQAYFIASWTPSWPPPSGYYYPLYDGIPGSYPGVVETKSISIKAPSKPGEYVLWFVGHAHYSLAQAINDEVGERRDKILASKGHILVVVASKQPMALSAYLTDFVQLTTNPQPDREPYWSPDGSKISWFAFDSSGWYRHIWVMNPDGSGKKQLTFGSVVDEGGDWSPDGKHIVFARYGLRGIDGFDLMVMDSDGSNLRQITSTGLSHQHPRWSPDGSKIGFSYGGAGTKISEIHVINPDGTGEFTLIKNAYHASWSPDGTRLVVDRDDGIWIVNALAPYEARRIFATNEPWTYPCFSPDGKYILFRLSGDLHLMDSDGNYIAKLTDDGTIEYPFDWSPDGKWIAFTSRKSGNPDIWKARIVITNLPAEPITLPHTWNYGITCYYLDLDLSREGYQQSIAVKPGQNVEAEIKFQRWSGAGNPSEINQVFLLYSWSTSWNPPSTYTPLWDGISGAYPGITKVVKFSFIAPKEPGTYFIWIRGDAMYSMDDALSNIWNKYHDQPPYSDDGGGIIGKVVVAEKEEGETTLFFDDFESYDVGTFPSSGGWILVWNGRGDKYQVVTGSKYHSPTKSLQLWGSYGWSSGVERRFSTNAEIIGFEAYVMVESYHSEEFSATIALWNKEKATWGKYYASVVFRSDHYIGVSGAPRADGDILIQPYEPNRWYKIKLILDRSRNVFSVWINDELKASDVKTSDSHEINALHLSSRWGSVKCYYDDVKVFVLPTRIHPLIKNALEALNSLNYGLKISAEKVDGRIKELPLKVLLSSTNLLISSLPIEITNAKLILYLDETQIPVAMNSLVKFTIARSLHVPINEVTDEVLEHAKDKTITNLYDLGGYREHFENIRKIVISLNDEFLMYPQDIMNKEFIIDFNGYLSSLQLSDELYSNQIDGIIKMHEQESFESNVLITAGSLGLIVITGGLSTPFVVVTRLGYFASTFILDLKREHDFIKTLTNTWYGQSIESIDHANKIVNTLQYILNKLKRAEPFPNIGYDLDAQHGVVWLKNEGEVPVRVNAKYKGVLTTYPRDQTYVNPIQSYEGYAGEFTLEPKKKAVFLLIRPEYDEVTKQWLKKATGYGLTVYEQGFFVVEYGEDGSGVFASKVIGPLTVKYEPYELKGKEIASVLMQKGTIPMPLNNIMITLIEPKGQEKLYLIVFDDEGNYVGLDKKTGIVNIGIAGAYYVDFGYGITIMLPLNSKLKKIVVDAEAMKENVGKYNLTTVVFRGGIVMNSTQVSSSITKGQTKEYEFRLMPDFTSQIKELPPIGFSIVFIYFIIITAVVLLISIITLSKVKKF